METLKVIAIMATLLLGLFFLISFWYVALALGALIATYTVARTYTTAQRIINED